MTDFTGDASADTFAGSWEDDLFIGRGGDDKGFGWDGNDSLYGGAGNDMLIAGLGEDLVHGGRGDDNLQGSGGNDSLYGEAGNDLIVVTYPGQPGTALAHGGTGDDTFMLFASGGGALVVGGAGIDRLALISLDETALTIDLSTQTLDGHGRFAGVTFTGIEALTLDTGSGDDRVTGGKGADDIGVGAGLNQVSAGAGDDLVRYTTLGASTLEGGTGRDTLQVDAGSASLYFIYDTFDGDVDDGQLSVISGFESYWAYGGQGDDIVGLGLGQDRFEGHDGNDTAMGRDGRDRLKGGEGDDLLSGGAGDDTLVGGAGNDVLQGDAGDDEIRFGRGMDTATGGEGADLFLFAKPGAEAATVTDFTSGEDHLGFLAALLPGLGGVQLSDGAPTGDAGQFVLVHGLVGDVLFWDSDGTGADEGRAWVHFAGHVTLEASDILIL